MKRGNYIISLLLVFSCTAAYSQQVYEADNGITASGSGTTRKVSLGGALTNNTTIPFGGFNLNFTGTGNIGIRTANPLSPLHVYKNVSGNYNPVLTLEDALTDGFVMFQMRGVNKRYNLGLGNGTWFDLQDDFFVWDDNNAVARLVVSSAGNVGIGVNDPANRLSIAGPSAGTSGLQFTQLNNTSTAIAGNGKVLGLDAGGNVILVTDAGAGTSWGITGNSGTTPGTDFIGTTDNQRLVFKTNNTEAGTFLANGNFGLGTDNPAAKLHVSGGFQLSHPTFAGSLTVTIHQDNVVRFVNAINGEFMRVGTGNVVDFSGQQVRALVRGAYLSNSLGGNSLETLNGNVALNTTGGNTMIGSTTDNGQKLQVNGTVRFQDQLSIIKPYAADAKVLDIGSSANAVSNLTLVYGNTNDQVTLNVGNTLAFNRNGGGAPSIVSSLDGLTVTSGTYTEIRTDDGAPGELRLAGNYSLGRAKFGAYNSDDGNLDIGNTYNNYQHLHHTNFKNGDVRITNTSNQVQAILTEAGHLGLGVATPAAQLHTTGTIRFAGLANNDALTRVLATDASGNVSWRDAATLGGGSSSNAWVYGGNSVTGTSVIGNTSEQDLQLITNNAARITVDGTTGNVGIGVTNPGAGYKLFVEEGIRTRKVRVDQETWPDYVFSPSYPLRPLSEVEEYIKAHGHLPEVPSEQEVKEKGIDLGDNQAVLLKKIEELTLYTIQLQKQMEEMKQELEKIKADAKK